MTNKKEIKEFFEGDFCYESENLVTVENKLVGEYTNYGEGDTKLERNNSDDAGQDLFSVEEVTIPPMKKAIISTNLSIKLPDNHVGLIWSRSGLAAKYDIEVGAGCIDQGYRGEVKVLLRNFGDEPYTVNKGDKIAQLLTVPVNLNNFIKVDNLSETNRGDKGFGSSGF